MDELKPCPFCGGKAGFDRMGTHRASCIISCGECGASLESNEEGNNCGRKWNQRAARPSEPESEGKPEVGISKRNVAINGKTWHLLKLAEECAELGAAILQHLTKGSPEERIQEEAGDVEIALLNLSTIYGRGIIETAKIDKLARIERRVSEQEVEARLGKGEK